LPSTKRPAVRPLVLESLRAMWPWANEGIALTVIPGTLDEMATKSLNTPTQPPTLIAMPMSHATTVERRVTLYQTAPRRKGTGVERLTLLRSQLRAMPLAALQT
jgi:hypothetical protein